MKTIKTKAEVSRTVKTIDRSINASNRIRNASSEIKEAGRDKSTGAETNPMEYATGQVEAGMQRSIKIFAKESQKVNNRVIKTARTAMKEGYIENNRRKNNVEHSKTSINIKSKKDDYDTKPSVKQRNSSLGRSRIKKSRSNQSLSKQAIRQSRNTLQKARRETNSIKKATTGTIKFVRAVIESTKALVSAIIAGGWVALAVVFCCIIFGAAFYFFGDESSKNYTPVSPEVEGYTTVIDMYAKEYGIREYTELIKAVMMQESGGKGKDPMQASESSFNKKYPNTPNGITHPEYSIKCGVQEIKRVLDASKCKSPVDMDAIRLALQGYNFGNGYIEWAIKKDGGYTIANAAEFSDKMAEKLGWDSYGDKQYVAHVLRYYPYGNYNYGVANTVIVNIAADQIGNKGGHKFWNWYGFDSHVEWCACFVSWCADQCGYIKSNTVPKFALVSDGVNWFKAKGQWQRKSYTPTAGDIIFFDWEGDGNPDHVGIVEKSDGNTVYTIEGNSSDECKRKSYTAGSKVIYGYGIAKY